MTQIDPVSAKSVPALARTDVRPADPVESEPPRRSFGRAILLGLVVLVAVALVVFGVVFALRHELVDPALLSADILEAFR